MKELSPEFSRLLAILIAVLLILAAALVATSLWNYYSTSFDRMEQQQRQLDQYHRLIASAGNSEGADTLAGTDASTDELFLPGSKFTIASANLRDYVGDIISAAGADLISSEEHAAEPIHATVPVGLQLRMRGSVQSLLPLLRDIETARPILFIDSVAVSGSRSGGRTSTRSSARDSEPDENELIISMNVVGYMVESVETGL